jgi:hypothetical protein
MIASKCRTSSSRLLATICFMSLALSFFVMSVAPAGQIVRSGTVDDQGKGFGNILVVLSLHDTGKSKDGLESGSISWSGATDVPVGSDVANQSQTRTVAEMLAKGIDSSNLAVIFNINQPGSSDLLHLQNFIVRGFDKAGNVLFESLFEAAKDPAYDPSGVGVPLQMQGGGQGGAGHVFSVLGTDKGISLADFFKDGDNRLGMEVPDSQPINNEPLGGADDFYVSAIAPIPEPASMTLLGIGFAGMLGYGWRKRRNGISKEVEQTPTVS